MSLIKQIRQIEQSLLSTITTSKQAREALDQLQEMDISTLSKGEQVEYLRIVEAAKKLEQQLKKTGETSKRQLEQMRRDMEGVVGKTTQFINKLAEAGPLGAGLARGLRQAGIAAKNLGESGDFGRFLQQITTGIPIVGKFGFALGTAVSAQVKLQDQLKTINRTMIDSFAATGRFAQGMALTATETDSLRKELAEYEQLTGVSRKETLGLVSALGKAGFTMKEMGIDEQTKHIQTFGEAITSTDERFGALSATIALARLTGLETSQVMEQLSFQTRQLGQSVGDATNMYYELQIAAERSKLSTQILLPIVKSIQEQYRFLGVQSSEAAESLGQAGEAARKAGLGAGVGAGVVGRAAAGLVGGQFGTQAFLGQQMQMGAGGLAAGFTFRRQAAEQPGGVAVGVAQVVRRLMGGRSVSREDAERNQYLASIRLGQEQLVMQMTGLSQLEASAYLDTTQRMEELIRTGKDDTEEFRKLKKNIEDTTMTEADYRKRTLTAQEKMARLMETISATLGEVFVSFIEGFAGTTGAGATGALKDLMESIRKGEGIDEFNDKMAKFTNTLGETLTPVARDLGEDLGGLINKVGGLGNALKMGAIAAGGGALLSVLNNARALAPVFKNLTGVSGSLATKLGKAGLIGIAGAAGFALGDFVSTIQIGDRSVAEHIGGWAASLLYGADAALELAKAHNKAALKTEESLQALEKITGIKTREELIPDVLERYKDKRGVGTLTEKYSAASLPRLFKQIETYAVEQIKRQEQLVKDIKDKQDPQSTLTRGRAEGQIEMWKEILQDIKQTSQNMRRERSLTRAGVEMEILQQISQNMRRERDSTRTGAEMEIPQGMQQIFQNMRRNFTRAGIEKAEPVNDAWNIIKRGWVNVSPGDVVIDAKALGTYLDSGFAGDVLKDNSAGRQRQMQDVPSRGGRRMLPMEQDIVLNVSIVDDRLGKIFDDRIHLNIEKGIVQPGKEGRSRLRHGSSHGGY